ncbi:MAG: TetR family transcriptional regulator C-terminal domain-containing protein [Dongiaceae bacterium]
MAALKESQAKPDRRRELIEATIRIIGRRGYASTTLSHVAGDAGLSPGIVNFYFKSKEQLLQETLEHLVEEYDRVSQAFIAAASPDAAGQLIALIAADFDPAIFTKEKVAVWYAFWAEAATNPAYRAVVSRLEAKDQNSTATICARLVREGRYVGIDSEEVASGLNAISDGFWFDSLIDPEIFDKDRALGICRLFLSGIFPRHFPIAERSPVANAAPAAVDPSAPLSSDRKAHCQRLAAALQRRLQPAGPWQVRDLALSVGVTPETVQNWLAGQTEPSSWTLGRLMAVLDPLFFVDVYGPVVATMQERFEQRLADARERERSERAAIESLVPPID